MSKIIKKETDQFQDGLIPSADMRACTGETGKGLSDFEKAATILRMDLPYEKMRIELLSLRSTTQNEELKKLLSERIAYDEKCMELYAHRSEGYVYVLILYTEEKETNINGYFADSDLAYFRGKRSGHRFRIEKYRLIDWDTQADGKENDGDAIPATGLEQDSMGPEGSYENAVAWLSFDETGELLSFGSEEVGLLQH